MKHVSDWVGNTSPSSPANSTPPTKGLELPSTICCHVLGVYPGIHRPQICAKTQHLPDLHHQGTDWATDLDLESSSVPCGTGLFRCWVRSSAVTMADARANWLLPLIGTSSYVTVLLIGGICDFEVAHRDHRYNNKMTREIRIKQIK